MINSPIELYLLGYDTIRYKEINHPKTLSETFYDKIDEGILKKENIFQIRIERMQITSQLCSKSYYV